ncbi:MAG: diversity-generating retroelement protein Avd [Candidatus Brocadiae bacterium]|nr:diversity-generating retroelement protein Avd [Candidatus Brocadiia bacterium]
MLKTPIFVKTYDFMLWLLQKTQRFPRNARWNLSAWLENSMGKFLSYLVAANQYAGKVRYSELEKADIELTLIRYWLRAAHDLKYIDFNAYSYASEAVNEIGRLLGAWKKISY